MKFTLAKTIQYVPDVFGNEDLDDDEQIVVEIEVPSATQTNTLFSSDGSGVNTENITTGVSRLVKSIENLMVNDKAITNGRELVAAPGMYMLVQNIGVHILSIISSVENDPT